MMRPTSIIVKYDTGQLDVAEGENAASLAAWWAYCEQFAMQRGQKYSGARFRRVDCINQVDGAPADAMVLSDVMRGSDRA